MLVLVNYLTGPVGQPVFDATGLEGYCALTLSFSWAAQAASDPTVDPGSTESGPNIFEVTVIDHLDRTPIEN